VYETVAGGITLTNGYVYWNAGTPAGAGFAYVSDATTGTVDHCLGTPTALCASGIIPADSSYSSNAGVGFNLNQALNSPTLYALTTPSVVSYVEVEYSGISGTGVRAQISVGNTYYCANLTTTNQYILASSFTTACWSTTAPGNPWDGTGATQLQLVVPAAVPAAIVSFTDLCLTGVFFN
jgi:hypothetical protein